MAREPSVLDDSDAAAPVSGADGAGGKSGLLHRRAYLKLASAAAAGTAAAAAAGTASADEYETIRVPANGSRTINIGSNETFENVLIDVSASGAWVTIIANGRDWTIRNVGIKGRQSAPGNATFGLIAHGTCRMENVYLGDGASSGHRHGLGVWLSPSSTGHLDIERVNIQEMGDNSFYCSAPMHHNGQGTVHFKNCYSANSWVSHYRLGRGVVENCVALNDARHKDGRGVWAWATGPVEVRDCDLAMNGRHYSIRAGANGRSTTVDVYDTQWDTGFNGGYHAASGSRITFHEGCGNGPDGSRVPEGCPTSAEQAASGGDGSDGGTIPDAGDDEPEIPDLPNVIVIDGREATTATTQYEFTVSEEVQPSEDDGATIDDAAEVDGGRARGVVANYLDAFRFSGELTSIDLDGDAAVRVNGVEIDPDDIGEDEDDGEEEFPHTILVHGTDDGVTRYEFEVDGDVVKSNYDGATIDGEDVVDGGRVHGVVANWKDAFRFDGELSQLTVDGPATVYVDDEAVDPRDFGEDLPHALEVVGSGDPASFEITVDGTIEFVGDDDPEDEVTIISGTTVQSSVTEGTLEFAFSGALTDVTFTSGEATVRLDGEDVDLSEYGDTELLPHALVIDGTEADGATTYSFRVSGKVVRSDHREATIDDEDVVEGRAVRGGVANWLDAFWFSGDIEDFKLFGDAKVHVEYNARDQ